METVQIDVGHGRKAMIDQEDHARVSGYQWSSFRINRVWYAATEVKDGGRLYLHRFLLNAVTGSEVDHRNGDGLDCRKSNLRTATHQQNLANQQLSVANRSGYKGVSRSLRGDKWVAQTKLKGRHVSFGYFRNIEDAARAYDAGMAALHGEFARLNFPVKA